MKSINEIEREMHHGEAFAGFVVAALDALVEKDQDGGCCPECCRYCSVLAGLLKDEDYLTELIPLDRMDKSIWWNRRTNTVDGVWIRTVWRKTICHTADITWAQRVSDELIKYRLDWRVPIVHIERSTGIAHHFFAEFEKDPTKSPLWVVEAYSVSLGFTLEKHSYLPSYR